MVQHERPAAGRAIDMLLAKLEGRPYASDIAKPDYPPFRPASPLANLADATIVLATDGGIIPCGNPDHIEASMATKMGKYPLTMTDCLEPNHGGYDLRFARENPFRVLPVDSLTRLAQRGYIKTFHPFWFTTAGNATAVEHAERFAARIVSELRKLPAPLGVLLTST